MPFLPIAERELRVAARKPATYRTRFWAVFICLIIFTWQSIWLTRGPLPSAMHGRIMFSVIAGLAFAYCLLIGARATADCVSEEKRAGTLGLLFLTDLKGYDVVLGKLVANSLNGFYGLVAIFPLLAICFLLGGISFAQFAKTAVALVSGMFFSLAAGIFVSTCNRRERISMFFTILVILFATFAPVLLFALINDSSGMNERELWPLLVMSPGFMYVLATESGGTGMFPPIAFWSSCILTWLLTIGFLFRASLKIPKSWQEKSANPLAAKLVGIELPRPKKAEANDFRAQALETNPFLWLALRGREKIKHAWGFILAIIAIWLLGLSGAGNIMWDYELLFPTLLFIHAFLKIWVISESCTRLVEDRRSGALELLLSTPLDVKEIIRGQHLALRRQFAAPVLLLMSLEALCFAFGWTGRETNWERKLFLPSAMILFAADFFTLRWVAMWIGLNSRNVNRAVLKTAMWVLAMPWILYLLLANFTSLLFIRRANPASFFFRNIDSDVKEILSVACWIALALVLDLILYRWAKTKMLARFRTMATEPIRADR